jgi:DNA-binding SARP family transcriptional activator
VGQRLNEVVHALRQTLEPGLERVARSTYIISDGPFLRLRLKDTDWVDFRAFEQMLRVAAGAADPLPLLKRASTIYRGDLFAEESIISCHSFREHLRDRWKQAMRRLADEQEKRDQVGDAILTLKRLIAAEPTFEPAVRQLMRLYRRIGSVGEAVGAYRQLKRALHNDIGAVLSRETRALYDSIMREASIEP